VQMSVAASQTALTPVETDIVAVTVYSDQARITRQGQTPVTLSDTVLDIGPLPAALQVGSVQAYAKGSAQIILHKPRLEPLCQTAELDIDRQERVQQLHTIEDTFRACKNTLSSLNQQRSFLESLSEKTATHFARGLSQQDMTLEAVAQFLEFFDQSYQRIARAIATQERHKHELDLQLQQARQALQQLEAAALHSRYRILLPIQVKQPGTLDISLIYDVSQAHWNPVYDVRLKADRQTLQIDCIAEIQQHTGEMWSNVAVKVSTVVPAKNPALPEADLLSIQPVANQQDPERKPEKRELRSRSPVLNETYRMLGALPGSEIPAQATEDDTVDRTNFQPANAIICLAAPAPAVVPSDGQPHRVPVGQLQLDSQLTYIALPQRSGTPYLCAELTNPPEKWPLLPGTASLFREGGYVGEVTFNYVAPGASFQISLGLDERIAVQRQLVVQETQKEGRCTDLRTFQLSIRNPYPHPIDLTVLEQIPVSTSDDITVDLMKTEPPITASKAGKCQWSIQLSAQETKHLYYQYAIAHPADITIADLDA